MIGLIVKILLLIVAGLVLPRLADGLLQATIGRRKKTGHSSLLLFSMMGFTRVGIWIVVISMILTTLGVDVTAILAGLGIGGLAFGLAAQPMIADGIAAMVIFFERRFTIGDVIKIGTDEPAKVVGLTWRSTQLRNAERMVVSIPNRKITEQSIQKLTHSHQTFDFIQVTVTTTHDPEMILKVMQEVISGSENLSPKGERGARVQEIEVKGKSKVVRYRFWWYLQDYDQRNQTRDEIFARVSKRLAEPDLEGTEIKLV